MKKKAGLHECQYCETLIDKKLDYCAECMDGIVSTALTDMYGEDDAAYFMAIDYFPGSN